MIRSLPQRARLALRLAGLVSFLALAACITSETPILTGAQPLLGNQLHLQLYVLRDGAAREPATAALRWRNGRYVPVRGTFHDMSPFTLHAFEGADLIAQSLHPGRPTEYAVARKLADGTYLLFVIDEKDADDATRAKYCSTTSRAECLVSTPEAVLAFARATAAKPHRDGGLAILLGH